MVLGLALLGAGCVKIYPCLSVATPTEPSDAGTTLSGIQGIFEAAFGLWLVSGLFATVSRKAALLCFSLFAAWAGYSVLAGHGDCGCFGRIAVPPAYTLAFDLAAVAALLTAWPRPMANAARSGRARDIAGACSFVLLLATAGWLGAAVARSAAGPTVVALVPEDWVGHRFPLFKHLDVGDQLMSGRWRAVFYRNDCPDCARSVPMIEKLAREQSAKGAPAGRICFIELPSHRDARKLVSGDGPWLSAHMDGSREWVGKTPFEIVLVEGRVVE